MTKAPPASEHPKVLIANRGEIACRVIAACKKLGLGSIAVFTDADAGTAPTLEADVAVHIGAKPGAYTDMSALLKAAADSGASAVHPGYGFLSENTQFAEAVQAAGMQFLGPATATMNLFALKHVAKDAAIAAHVPVLSGSDIVHSAEDAAAAADGVGYPVLLKATGGGGGMGIYKCFSRAEVLSSFALAVSQGAKSFGNGDVFVEKFIANAKHIEVQVFGDGEGLVIALGDRECSVQRRHQKVIEECPSPFVDDELRGRLMAAATELCSAAKYRSAGTVEFLVDADTRGFYFLEVNTRLQVEHGITEMVTGTDIVEMMLRLQLPVPAGVAKASTPDSFRAELQTFELKMSGSAIECRLLAENPCHGLMPTCGMLGEVAWPDSVPGLRVDTWIKTGTEVTHHYDSLLAKVMVHQPTRAGAIAAMLEAVGELRVKGIPTNTQLLQAILVEPAFGSGAYTTHLIDGMHMEPRYVEVLDAGMQTTVQDWPGRVQLWKVGVPPSGPMDATSLRYANALVGNPAESAGLEITMRGPSLKFHCPCTVAVCGGSFKVTVDGTEHPMWSAIAVGAGQVVAIGAGDGHEGLRSYLAVSGGVDAPIYLGSRSTFPTGNIGGFQGRALQAGDSCELGAETGRPVAAGLTVPAAWRPAFGEAGEDGVCHTWKVRMIPGPQADPDYFTSEDIATLSSTSYKVHYNSNRLGIRLTGAKPQFARPDGGEGGAHPSNVHDHVYALGTINFSGDMPIILTVDGPSLGGFVCPATTIEADMWKWGQVKPGDAVFFEFVSLEDAYEQRWNMDECIKALTAQALGTVPDALAAVAPLPAGTLTGWPETKAVLQSTESSQWRLAGDRYVFVEFGPMVLDLNIRVKIDKLEEWLAAQKVPGLLETSPGVRSVMVEYDARLLPLPRLMELLQQGEAALPDVTCLKLPSRILQLPMAFHERWTKEATDKYMQSVRPEAAYLPDNVKFLAETNGMTVDGVRDVMFEASYMIMGLGDVYLGAPCAVPVNPLHRLVAPKYNPARTFTWEGTVGIGGAYMCIYPMCSPGGYQLVGRTLPIWNSFGKVAPFSTDKPWLLNNFDQVRYVQVSEDELEKLRADFVTGAYKLEVTEEMFDMAAYNAHIASIEPEVAAWKEKQAKADKLMQDKEREIMARLEASGYVAGASAAADGDEEDADDGSTFSDPRYCKVLAPYTASVWEICVAEGDVVTPGQQLMVLEAMKMETPVPASAGGTVVKVCAKQNQLLQRSAVLVVVDTTPGVAAEAD